MEGENEEAMESDNAYDFRCGKQNKLWREKKPGFSLEGVKKIY